MRNVDVEPTHYTRSVIELIIVFGSMVVSMLLQHALEAVNKSKELIPWLSPGTTMRS